MARYTVIPTDRSEPVTRISARDGCAIVELVSRIRCKSADVFEGGRYKYSLRIEPSGMWCIYQRKHECVPLELVPNPAPEPRGAGAAG